jgi:hypothetical protein
MTEAFALKAGSLFHQFRKRILRALVSMTSQRTKSLELAYG